MLYRIYDKSKFIITIRNPVLFRYEISSKESHTT
ncbi:MAG: hypothetical protein EZS26_003581 [Candidatus Ordinivivax streblomastigis]|uniref:Uncharacterized protein n=1 Tax=Candidatus Ordinivivax streblomastigis TaxID=2540710 RepID=A0A5M8NU48_9BACT|nr:MAG: hypothetical protein EZS26_003581 [Candidatus Ordinivivax streblomastigis]